MKNAKVMFSQWGGQRQRFVGNDGMVVITKNGDEWFYKTAWSKIDYDEESIKIMEMVNRYVK